LFDFSHSQSLHRSAHKFLKRGEGLAPNIKVSSHPNIIISHQNIRPTGHIIEEGCLPVAFNSMYASAKSPWPPSLAIQLQKKSLTNAKYDYNVFYT
jgi:hypothetical protein